MDKKDLGSTQSSVKYDAFISYKSTAKRDAIVANYLHKMLERYELPGSFKSLGYQGRFKRVFKDNEELSASSNLYETLYYMLKQSKTLIVVYSDETYKSKWVEWEIKTYIQMGMMDRIIILLTEGEIHDNLLQLLKKYDVGIKLEDSSYENAEQNRSMVEVIDIRGNTEVESIKKLKRKKAKIIARIIDCDLDIITTFDEHISSRKNRFMKLAILVGAIVLMASVFILNILEQSKADELIIQKRVAKKVLYNIANDIDRNTQDMPEIRNEIKNVFNKDIQNLKQNNSKLAASGKSNKSNSDIATNYILMSNLNLLSGDVDAAANLYEDAINSNKIKDKLTIEYGELIDITSDYVVLGELKCRQKKYKDAIETYKEVFELNKKYKDREDSGGIISKIQHKTKNMLIFFGLCKYVNSPSMMELVINQNTALIYQKIGDAYINMHQNTEAINAYYKCLDIMNSMPDEKTTENKLNAVTLYNKLGNANYLIWNIDTSITWYRCSMEILDQLLNENKENKLIAFNKMMTYKYIGDAFSIIENKEEALKNYTNAIEVCKKYDILAYAKKNFKMYNDTSLIFKEYASKLLMKKEVNKALENYKEFLCMEQIKYENLKNRLYIIEDKNQINLYLSDIKSSMSFCNLMLNNSESAITDANDAILINPDNYNAVANLAFGLCAQGRTSELKELFKEVELWPENRSGEFYNYCIFVLKSLQRIGIFNEELKNIKILLN